MLKANYILIPLVVLATALLGSWFTSFGMDWYQTLNLPGWTPSGSVIGAVWTVIFILGAVSALLFVNKSMARDRHFRKTAWLLGLNALLNLCCSYLFFVEHLFVLALLEMLLLNLTTLLLIIRIKKVSRLAAGLLAPYFLWVSFAAYLTYQIWQMNPGL